MFEVNGIPTQKPDDWRHALAEPSKQWKPGCSAWALAHAWEAAQGFPPEISTILQPEFPNIQMIKGYVEHKVNMPGKGKPSQNDLLVHASHNKQDIWIAVEGKVSETLGETVGEWHNATYNKEFRLSGILNLIGLPRAIPNTIRYQLLHRLASPILMAKKFNASHAVMLIHSFSQADESFTDFAAFLALYGLSNVQHGQLYSLKTTNEINLYAGWVRGNQRFLKEQPAGENDAH